MSKEYIYWILGLLHIIWSDVTDSVVTEMITTILGCLFILASIYVAWRES